MRATKLVDATNLVFPNQKMQLKDALKSDVNQEKFAAALVDLLYGKDRYEEAFPEVRQRARGNRRGQADDCDVLSVHRPSQRTRIPEATVTQQAELFGCAISYQSTLAGIRGTGCCLLARLLEELSGRC